MYLHRSAFPFKFPAAEYFIGRVFAVVIITKKQLIIYVNY